MEIGCGDGALLAELGERGLAPVLDGFELSPPAAELARARSIPGARRIEAFDGEHVPAEDGAYDLAVLSHVLEHVPEPGPLLREAARVAPAVLVEVPLEANRSAARPGQARGGGADRAHPVPRPRGGARARPRGGPEVAAELSDPLPYAHHAFFAASRGRAGPRRAQDRRPAQPPGAPPRARPSGCSPSTTPAWRGGCA